MVTMENPANGRRSDGATDQAPALPEPSETAESIEFYETGDGTVLYDAENPMAWIYSDGSVRLPEHR